MKTSNKKKKKFDAVKMMRDIRNSIDKETAGMTFEEEKEFFKKRALNFLKKDSSENE